MRKINTAYKNLLRLADRINFMYPQEQEQDDAMKHTKWSWCKGLIGFYQTLISKEYINKQLILVLS